MGRALHHYCASERLNSNMQSSKSVGRPRGAGGGRLKPGSSDALFILLLSPDCAERPRAGALVENPSGAPT